MRFKYKIIMIQLCLLYFIDVSEYEIAKMCDKTNNRLAKQLNTNCQKPLKKIQTNDEALRCNPRRKEY